MRHWCFKAYTASIGFLDWKWAAGIQTFYIFLQQIWYHLKTKDNREIEDDLKNEDDLKKKKKFNKTKVWSVQLGKGDQSLASGKPIYHVLASYYV